MSSCFILALFFICQWPISVESYTPQPNVLSDGKVHGLYIWIHLKDGVDIGMIMRQMAKFHKYIEDVCSGNTCHRSTAKDPEDDELIAGIGFGYEFYTQAVSNNNLQDYNYRTKRGLLGELPYTGGDILVHAKSNSRGKLFELSQAIRKNLPPEAIAEYKDTYGFKYKDGRDLSGFIDVMKVTYEPSVMKFIRNIPFDFSSTVNPGFLGTENPPSNFRFNTAIDPNTNGSYCITQEWIHHMGYIATQPVPTLESFVGRRMNDSVELHNKSMASHVARMTSGPQYKAPKLVTIYRQSMPYGTVGGDAGLFFIAYAASPNNFEVMLSRMTGSTEDTSDDIMRISRCVTGNYWYFPPVEELERLQNSVPGAGALRHVNVVASRNINTNTNSQPAPETKLTEQGYVYLPSSNAKDSLRDTIKMMQFIFCFSVVYFLR